MLAALNGAFPSLQARHEKQRLLFFAESLIQPHFRQSHEAARTVRGDRMELRGSRGRFGMSTEEDLGREDSTSSDRRAYIRSMRYNQKTTPHIKWRGK